MSKINKNSLREEYKVPESHIVSEGETLIKALSQKQLNKNIYLHEELSREKPFTKSTELFNITACASGESNYKNFKECERFINNLEELQSYGLTQDEIELFNEYQNGEEFVFIKHKNMCRSVLQEKLKYIVGVIETAKSQSINENKRFEENSSSVSRHIKEIALSTKPESDETKLYKFALSCNSIQNSKNSTNFIHPINQLPQLEKELFGHLNRPTVPSLKKRRKKAKKFLDSVNINHCDAVVCDKINTNTSKKRKSKWDNKDITSNNESVKIYTCKRQPTDLVQISNCSNDDTVKVPAGTPFVGWQQINTEEPRQKLTEEQIKSINKFVNYERGTPSKVLFVKNLAKSTKEKDLVGLFSRFDNEDKKIIYRLLTGKMKGQAFITFNSVIQATNALENLNGCILNNKPIIIQYGKNAS